MPTRAEIRASLRLRLEDTGPSPLWDDATMNEAIAAAVRAYGAAFPKQITTGVTVPAGATRVATGTTIDPARITRVTDAAGIWVPPWPPWEAQTAGGNRGQAWRWWGSELILAEPAASSAAGLWSVEHLAGRTPPAIDGEAVDVLPGDEAILLALAEAAALARRAVEDAKRGARADTAPRAEAARREADGLIAARRRRARGGSVGSR
jgi:hypothetical protein